MRGTFQVMIHARKAVATIWVYPMRLFSLSMCGAVPQAFTDGKLYKNSAVPGQAPEGLYGARVLSAAYSL